MSDHSRRSWIITISQAAVGLGMTGEIPAAIQGDTRDAAALLPPGVYLPSSDHLSHALMSAERFHPIPAGCPTDYVRPANTSFQPLFFSIAEFQVIKRLAQLLLGDDSGDADDGREAAEWIDLRVSSAGGAHDAQVHLDPSHLVLALAYLGPAQLAAVNTADPAKICREGLQWIAGAAHAQHSKEFLALGAEEQISILHSISDDREIKQSENAGTRLFTLLKTETIKAFYTSRAGLKELDFKGNAFYTRSPGCEPQLTNRN